MFRIRVCHPLWRCFPASSPTYHSTTSRSYNPVTAGTVAVWANPRSLATTWGITFCFLFLRVLRCFSSPGSPLTSSGDSPSDCRVVPFGNLRVNGHLRLTAAYRSLSRPSSPARAQASTVRPFLLLRLYAFPSRKAANILKAVLRLPLFSTWIDPTCG